MRQFLAIRQQRGSAIVWTIMLTTMFLFAALIIDGARVYQLQRQLQSMANALATDLSNDSQTCYGIHQELSDSAASLPTGLVRQRLKQLYLGKPELASINDVVVRSADRVLVEAQDNRYQVLSAVGRARSSNGTSVVLERPITGLLAFAMDSVTASATVRKEMYATFYPAGSTLSLPGGKDNLLGLIFNGILGTDVRLDSVSFDDLQNTLVDLDDLLRSILHLGGLDLPGGLLGLGALLETDIPAHVLLGALKGVSSLVDGLHVLDSVDKALPYLGIDTSLKLGDVINIVGEGAIQSGAKLPVLSVLSSVILNLGAKQLQDINLGVDVAKLLGIPSEYNILSLGLQVAIDEAPAVVVAPARMALDDDSWIGTATASDIKVKVSLKLDLVPNTPVKIILEVPLELSTGYARARFIGASCAQGNDNLVDLQYEVQRGVLALSTFNDGILARVGLDVPDFRKPYSLCGIRTCWFDYTYNHRSGGNKPWGCLLNNWGWCVPDQSESGKTELNLVKVQIASNPVETEQMFSTKLTIEGVGLDGDLSQMVGSGGSCTVQGNQTIECHLTGDSGKILAGTLKALLDGLDVRSAQLVGIELKALLNILVDGLNAVLSPILEVLSVYVLGPVLESLGIQLGNAKINVIAASQPAMLLMEGCSLESC